MFWTEMIVQRNLFDDDEPISSATVSRLLRFAKELFPKGTDQELLRQFAFLTIQGTQTFLGPMLIQRYGSLDNAKLPTLDWLNSIGSLETFARGTRDGLCPGGKVAGLTPRKIPAWYTSYLESDHWEDVKDRATNAWRLFAMDEGLRCSFHARHEFAEWHHSDYGRIGEGDEFRFLIPLCHDCHEKLRFVGPNVPAEIPEGVKRWL